VSFHGPRAGRALRLSKVGKQIRRSKFWALSIFCDQSNFYACCLPHSETDLPSCELQRVAVFSPPPVLGVGSARCKIGCNTTITALAPIFGPAAMRLMTPYQECVAAGKWAKLVFDARGGSERFDFRWAKVRQK
jgi:hypothetical protein